MVFSRVIAKFGPNYLEVLPQENGFPKKFLKRIGLKPPNWEGFWTKGTPKKEAPY